MQTINFRYCVNVYNTLIRTFARWLIKRAGGEVAFHLFSDRSLFAGCIYVINVLFKAPAYLYHVNF